MSDTGEPQPPGYPVEFVERAYLRDGTEVLFRPILPTDDVRLQRLFHRLSPEALYRRFFTPVVKLDRKTLHHLVNVDYVNRMAIVAQIGD